MVRVNVERNRLEPLPLVKRPGAPGERGEVLIWSTRAAARYMGETMRTGRVRGVEEAMSTRLTQSSVAVRDKSCELLPLM